MPRGNGSVKGLFIATGQFPPKLTSRYLVKGLLDAGSLSCLYGRPKGGKTFIALDIALRVSAGMTWRDRKVRQCGVLYVGAEGGEGLHNRICAWMRQNVSPNEEICAFACDPYSINMLDNGRAKLIERVKLAEAALHTEIGLIVLDTVARVMGGGDENSPKDMGALIRACDEVRELIHTHIMLLHHTGKNEDRGMRGHSSLLGAVDTAIEVDGDARGSAIIMREIAQKDQAAETEWGFTKREVTLGRDEDGDIVKTIVLEGGPVMQRLSRVAQRMLDVIRALAQDAQIDAITDTAWRSACYAAHLSRNGVLRAEQAAFKRGLAELVDQGYVETAGDRWLICT